MEFFEKHLTEYYCMYFHIMIVAVFFRDDGCFYKALLSGGCVEERIMQLKGGRRDKNVIRFLLYTYID